MTDEDWRRVWAIPTVDTDGQPTKVFVGQVERDGQLVAAVRIDSGPTALIPIDEVVGELLRAIRATAEAAYVRNQRSES